ncbi:hypothetical protein [Enterococcus sp. DIV0800]|uniref:hypothetical protein n=1 Tax=unclassified Enterococcus TaxID=2608891 RepID=UPI003D301565
MNEPTDPKGLADFISAMAENTKAAEAAEKACNKLGELFCEVAVTEDVLDTIAIPYVQKELSMDQRRRVIKLAIYTPFSLEDVACYISYCRAMKEQNIAEAIESAESYFIKD